MLASGEHPTIVLKVTVFADGSLGDIFVEHTAGPAFDTAAIEAVRGWKFAPALRGEEAIASRVSVAVHFELPELSVHEVTAITGVEEAVPHDHDHDHERDDPAREPRDPTAPPSAPDGSFGASAQVHGPERTEDRGAMDLRISGQVLRAAPARDGGELLARAPGMVVMRVEGDAVAQRIMLRGFDADHGQDVELNVDGVPVNQPSHIHGQGYADLGFMIPETVRSLRVTEGVYDPRQGDFAVAGSADFELGVEERGLRLVSSYGSFRSFRELALYAPPGLHADTFGAVVFEKTRGFGQNRAGTSAAAVGQFGWGSRKLRTTLHASLYGARALTANVVRRDDVEAGRIGFHDVYPLATAEAQSGASQRAQISTRTRYHGDLGENAELSAYLLVNTFRLQANYTGFTETSRENPSWSGRGDLIEQRNDDRTLGLKGRYRSPEQRPLSFLRGFYEAGISGRFDQIEQTQRLVQAPENTTWDRRIDASVDALDVGGYLDLDATFVDRVSVRGGVRANLLSYQIDDRLANFVAAYRKAEHIPGYRRSAAGIAAGPRVTVDVRVIDKLSAIFAYGEGYRSPMALLLDDGEAAPFVRVRSSDLGVKLGFGDHDELELRATGYLTTLDDDVVFDPREGRVTPVGPSRRLGAVFHALARPWPWLVSALSVTYVDATLEEPPSPTVEDPDPPFKKGEPLPYVPPVVIRADVSAERKLLELNRVPLTGRAGAGFSHWSSRPLPFGERASPVSLLDAELALGYRPFTVSASCFNLLDSEYAALELVYASSWDPDGFASRVPKRHIMAGAPRTLFFSIEVRL
jgi:TonB family protein